MSYQFLCGFKTSEGLIILQYNKGGDFYEIWNGEEHIMSGIDKKETIKKLCLELDTIFKDPTQDLLEVSKSGKVLRDKVVLVRDLRDDAVLNFTTVLLQYTQHNKNLNEIETFLVDMEKIVFQSNQMDIDKSNGVFNAEEDYFKGINTDTPKKF